jgi:hypothetical protein
MSFSAKSNAAVSKPEDTSLCAFCAALPFPELAGMDVASRSVPLQTPLELARTLNCPLCQVFTRELVETGHSIDPSQHFWDVTMWATRSVSDGYDYYRPVWRSGSRISFDLWNDADYDVSQTFARRPLKERVDPELLRSWYNCCQQEHGCKDVKLGGLWKSRSTKVRLIDVMDTALVEINLNDDVDYVALTYVWFVLPRGWLHTHLLQGQCRPTHHERRDILRPCRFSFAALGVDSTSSNYQRRSTSSPAIKSPISLGRLRVHRSKQHCGGQRRDIAHGDHIPLCESYYSRRCG